MKETLTSNARAVLDVVRATREHPTAIEIYETVKLRRPHIGLASVYRILHQLVEQGHIKEIGRSEESCRYDGQTSRHDHAVCTECGKLLDLPMEVTLAPELLQQTAQAAGIELGSYEVRLYGRCTACQQKTASISIA